MAEIVSRLVCPGCGWEAPAHDPAPFSCPRRGDGGDHVLRRVLTADEDGRAELRTSLLGDDVHPFLAFRRLLHSYRSRVGGDAFGARWSDAAFVDLVERLDAGVARVDGRGFRRTPFEPSAGLGEALGVGEAWVKDETGNVSGTHKARHLFGLLLWLRSCGDAASRAATLAIASCGNAALGAAVVARAAGRRLEVFVPPWADPRIVERLEELEARLVTCPRVPGRDGDPCYRSFQEAVAAGALPFTCQGSENALTLDGGQTLGWEIAADLAAAGRSLDRLFVQVGGGALATACARGLREAHDLGVLPRLPRLHAVQTAGAHPLVRAWDRLVGHLLSDEGDATDRAERARRVAELPPARIAAGLAHAARHRDAFMWPWEEEPRSLATGILDDETYDWLAVVEEMLLTGGYPVTVTEDELCEAHGQGTSATGIPVDPTGTAGLAGGLQLARRGELGAGESVLTLFTGRDRRPTPDRA